MVTKANLPCLVVLQPAIWLRLGVVLVTHIEGESSTNRNKEGHPEELMVLCRVNEALDGQYERKPTSPMHGKPTVVTTKSDIHNVRLPGNVPRAALASFCLEIARARL